MQPGFDTVTTESAANAEAGSSSASAPPVAEENRAERLKSPALLLALAFALGIAAGHSQESLFALTRSIPELIALSCACLLSGTVLVRVRREVPAALVVLAGFVLAGAAATSLFTFRFRPNHVSNLKSWGIDLNRPINLTGILVSDPIRSPAGLEFDLEATELDQPHDGGAAARRLVTGHIRVIAAYGAAVDSSTLGLRSGDRILTAMRLRQPRVYRNPGSFDFRQRAQAIEDLYWEGSIDDGGQLHKLPTVPPEAQGASSKTSAAVSGVQLIVCTRRGPPKDATARCLRRFC